MYVLGEEVNPLCTNYDALKRCSYLEPHLNLSRSSQADRRFLDAPSIIKPTPIIAVVAGSGMRVKVKSAACFEADPARPEVATSPATLISESALPTI